ncbi:anticodon-binding domain-containing protein [Phyllosticta citribraziliensis]|uniref:Anticodon-binding domain-containing protein n=1 Tax=Phyllosticta citribraziliensis TaxID=989973 RepID=A0ABR1LEF6_9PEZI
MAADGKRLSTAGKVATPKLGDQSILNDSHLYKIIGKRVKITTTIAAATSNNNGALEGVVYAADPVLNILAVNTAPAPPNPATNLASQPGNYHVISIPHIQDFKILASGGGSGGEDGAVAADTVGGFEAAVPSIGTLDLGALKRREEEAVKKLIQKEATRGRGVPKEAQEIFDAINKTLPARWHEQSIVINDAVILGPPYTLNDLKAGEGKEMTLAHIRKIMESHLAKKKASGGQPQRPGVATPIPPRKGG